MKNSFFLVIPEQSHNQELLDSFEEAILSRWISELPTANPSLSIRLFHDLISEMNQLIMPAQNRLNALELLRHDFLSIEDYLRSRLILTGFPKTVNELKIMEVLVSVEKVFTIGYWIILRELTKRGASWFQKKHTALALQRTMRGLSQIVVTHAMMNTPAPGWIWLDLHSLYRLSVKIKKDTAKVNEEASAYSKQSTPEECYKQILLFSLTNPSGLMQREYLSIYNYIEKFTGLVQIEKQPVAEQAAQCIILAEEDSPPCFAATAPARDSVICYLNLTRLNKILEQPEKFSSADMSRFSSIDRKQNRPDKLPAELMYYLTDRWLGKPLQGLALFSDRLNRLFTVGLEATHKFQDSLLVEEANTLEYMADSSSERALACEFNHSGALSVGSLVSFRKIDTPRNLRTLGVVCKLLLGKKENTLIFELNIITPQSFAVTYRVLDAEPDSEPHKALMFAKKENDIEKSFIILDTYQFKDGDLLRLYLNQENFPIILKDRKNIGLGYWQFECRRLAEKMLPSNQKKKGYDFI